MAGTGTAFERLSFWSSLTHGHWLCDLSIPDDVRQGMAVVPLQLRSPALALTGAPEERPKRPGPASSMDPSPDPDPCPADAVLLRLSATGDLYVNNCRLLPGPVRIELQVGAGAAQPKPISAGTPVSLGPTRAPGEAPEMRALAAAAGSAHELAAEGSGAAAEPLGQLGAMLGGGLKGPGPTYDIRAPTGGPADAGPAPSGPASADMPAAAAAGPAAAAAGIAVAPARAAPAAAAPAIGSAARDQGSVRKCTGYLCRALLLQLHIAGPPKCHSACFGSNPSLQNATWMLM